MLTRRYNEALRAFARERGIVLVDFEQHAYDHFVPRSTFFGDSVHPSIQGYVDMGRFLAAELWARVIDG